MKDDKVLTVVLYDGVAAPVVVPCAAYFVNARAASNHLRRAIVP